MDTLNSLGGYGERFDRQEGGGRARNANGTAGASDKNHLDNFDAQYGFSLQGDGNVPFKAHELPIEISNLADSLDGFSYDTNGQPGGEVNGSAVYGASSRVKAEDFSSQGNGLSFNMDEENAVNSPASGDVTTPQLNLQSFSPNPTEASLGAPPMNQRSSSVGKSYTNYNNSNNNNLLSPGSTYDSGFTDSPYGSYQGSYNDSYLRSPMNSPPVKSYGSPSSVGLHMNRKKEMSKEGKLGRRRELHNAVERRRREHIKEKILELGTLIPPTLLHDSSKLKGSSKKEVRANKSTILIKTVDYIQYLQDIIKMQDERKLMLGRRIEELEGKESAGSPVDSPKLGQVNTSSSDTFGFTPVRNMYSSGTSPFAGDSPTGAGSAGPTGPSGASPMQGSSQQVSAQEPVQLKYEDPDDYLKEFLTTPTGETPNFNLNA